LYIEKLFFYNKELSGVKPAMKNIHPPVLWYFKGGKRSWGWGFFFEGLSMLR
jgi:hypothetical protein